MPNPEQRLHIDLHYSWQLADADALERAWRALVPDADKAFAVDDPADPGDVPEPHVMLDMVLDAVLGGRPTEWGLAEWTTESRGTNAYDV
ncbi:hypothetical protein RQM47_16345 [Rubrivirga sp. S365]|uniref:hypothetical protein n=1 Tax=Rubrivirga sp. S365 TaxID=3076080 RepID=UPI0028CA1934|nr:hypothetical protein [Rubrivirga sp. S365]MDT7858220.1 hypothetical protein [Rubrivirga sp. S365]